MSLLYMSYLEKAALGTLKGSSVDYVRAKTQGELKSQLSYTFVRGKCFENLKPLLIFYPFAKIRMLLWLAIVLEFPISIILID